MFLSADVLSPAEERVWKLRLRDRFQPEGWTILSVDRISCPQNYAPADIQLVSLTLFHSRLAVTRNVTVKWTSSGHKILEVQEFRNHLVL